MIAIRNVNAFYNGKVQSNVDIVVNGDKIERIGAGVATLYPHASATYEGDNLFILPNFIDIHIHGLHGFDTSDASVDSILGISNSLARYGVGAFCPTVYTQVEDKLLNTVASIAKSKGKESGPVNLGMHLEGPFISPLKKGAQPAEAIREVDVKFMERIYEAAEGFIRIMTIAPELANIEELMDFCRKHNIITSAGHTNANCAEMKKGALLGVKSATHLFNAMPPLSHRDPGCIGEVLSNDNLYAEFIGDFRHSAPEIVKIVTKLKPEKAMLVTDCLRPANQTDGVLLANNKEVYLKDELFHHKDDHTIAGSTLTMLKGFFNLLDIGCSYDSLVHYTSLNQASLLGLDVELKDGHSANFVIVDDNHKQLVANYINGKNIIL